MNENNDDFKDLKNNIDLALKDICVSDALKSKTMKKIKKSRTKNYMVFTAAAASIFILFSASFYTFSIKNKIENVSKNSYKRSIAYDIHDKAQKPEKAVDNEANKTLKPEIIPKKTIQSFQGIANAKKTAPASVDSSNVKLNKNSKQNAGANIPSTKVALNLSDSSPDLSTSNSLCENLTRPDLTEASKYLGSNVQIPQYLPKGFRLSNTILANSQVKLVYSLNNSTFTVTEEKKHPSFNACDNCMVAAAAPTTPQAITSGKNSSQTENNDNLIWENENLSLSISGNLSKDVLINIKKSIK